jgi:hypothetical protein
VCEQEIVFKKATTRAPLNTPKALIVNEDGLGIARLHGLIHRCELTDLGIPSLHRTSNHQFFDLTDRLGWV